MQPATNSAGALANLNAFQGQMQSPDAIYTGASQTLGVPQAQQQVSGLRQAITNTTNLLNQIAPSVYGRTQNSLVTDAQAGRQIQNEQAPVQTKLSGLNTSEGNAASDLQSLLGQAGTIAQLKASGQQDQYSNLENIYKDLSASEQAQAAQQLEQQKLAEQVREANLTNASSSGGSSSASTAQLKQQDMAGAAQYLQSKSGGDGHVSQSVWNQALANWTAAGYNTSDFVKQYGSFINRKYTGYHGFD